MSIKWLVFFFATWFTLAFIGAGVEQGFSQFASGGDYTTAINQLMGGQVVITGLSTGHFLEWLATLGWIGGLVRMLTFQFSFMQGFEGAAVYLIVFAPIGMSMLIATLFSLRGSPATH